MGLRPLPAPQELDDNPAEACYPERQGEPSMTLHLELPTEIEQALRAHAEAAGQPIDAFVAECVAQRLAVPEPPAREVPVPETKHVARAGRSQRQFAERLKAFIDLHPRLDTPVDDSRESIYAGRGE